MSPRPPPTFGIIALTESARKFAALFAKSIGLPGIDVATACLAIKAWRIEEVAKDTAAYRGAEQSGERPLPIECGLFGGLQKRLCKIENDIAEFSAPNCPLLEGGGSLVCK